MVAPERMEELESYFWNESNDEETEYWREDLTGEEQKIVNEWDKQYASSVCKICGEILKTEKE